MLLFSIPCSRPSLSKLPKLYAISSRLCINIFPYILALKQPQANFFSTPTMPRYKRGGYKSKTGATGGRDEVHIPNSSAADESSSQKQRHAKPSQLTHFLCLPLVNSTSRGQLEASLTQFRDVVAKGGKKHLWNEPTPADFDAGTLDGGDVADPSEQNNTERFPNVPEKAIRPVGTLHLTLGVMSLTSPDKLEQAIGLLKQLNLGQMLRGESSQSANEEKQERLTDNTDRNNPEPLRLSLRGLESMHPVQRTSVLYAAPHDTSDRLQAFGEALRSTFMEAGFVVPDDRPLKLHATIINMIYAKKGGRTGRSQGYETQQRSHNMLSDMPVEPTAATEDNLSTADTVQSIGSSHRAVTNRMAGNAPDSRGFNKFDATALVKHFKDFDWANDVVVDKVAICKMGAKKLLNEQGNIIGEEYEEVASSVIPI